MLWSFVLVFYISIQLYFVLHLFCLVLVLVLVLVLKVGLCCLLKSTKIIH